MAGTPAADAPPVQIARDRRLLGARLREARSRRGISVRELGRRTDCSASLISQIELGKIAPSVSTLYVLTTTLGVSMDSLFLTDDAPPARETPAGDPPPADDPSPARETPARDSLAPPAVPASPPERPANGRAAATGTPEPMAAPAPSPAEADVVQRRDSRPHISLQHGIRWERLNPHPEVGAEFLQVTYEAGGGSRAGDPAIRHNGREYGLVLEGVLTVQIGFESYVLQAGDSVAFDSTVPHRFWNSGDTPVRAIWFELKANGPSAAAADQPPSAHSRS